jgi:hypothetical protein
MTRDLRKPPKAHLFEHRLCDVAWQGDFGKGVQTGGGIFSDPGANPWVLGGPIGASGSLTVATIPVVQAKLGLTMSGDYESEWIFCRIVLASATDLKPGMLFIIDENYTAALATGTGKVLGSQVGVGYFFAPAVAAGTYYGYLARAGHLLVKDAGASVAAGSADTTATAGGVKFSAAHTAGQGTSSPFTAYGASSNITFKGNTVNGSPYITAVASQIAVAGVPLGGIADLCPGMTITGAGLPANSLIQSIDQQGGLWRITLGTDTAGAFNTVQNATANGTGVTFTVTSHVQALMYWPTITNVA